MCIEHTTPVLQVLHPHLNGADQHRDEPQCCQYSDTWEGPVEVGQSAIGTVAVISLTSLSIPRGEIK